MASPVTSIRNVTENSAFNVQTLRGQGCTLLLCERTSASTYRWVLHAANISSAQRVGLLKYGMTMLYCSAHPFKRHTPPTCSAACRAPGWQLNTMNTTTAFVRAGNVLVDGIAATQYGMAAHLPAWEAADIERLKLAADAKMRMAYRLFPSATRQLHAWRLLTPLYNAVGALGRQVRQCTLVNVTDLTVCAFAFGLTRCHGIANRYGGLVSPDCCEVSETRELHADPNCVPSRLTSSHMAKGMSAAPSVLPPATFSIGFLHPSRLRSQRTPPSKACRTSRVEAHPQQRANVLLHMCHTWRWQVYDQPGQTIVAVMSISSNFAIRHIWE
jgi:hypothetical protein